MKYGKILTADIADGLGFRVSLWVSGCDRHCPGCFNVEAQNPEFGKIFDDEAKQKIFDELDKPFIRGFSLLGGEPMSHFSDNRKQCIQLCKEIKERYPDKDIWIWSGYTLEEISAAEDMKDILKYVDVLVDGPFIQEKKDLAIAFRGSRNQRVLYRGKDF